jgi:hypothetical protein
VAEMKEFDKNEIINSGEEERSVNSNNKNVIIAIVAAIVIFIISFVVVGAICKNGDVEPTETVESTVSVSVDITESKVEPTEPLRLINESNKPTFTIGGNEYELGCEFGSILNGSNLKISNIDAYLHYNREALIIQPGNTRDWEIQDDTGKTLNVTIFNDTQEKLSSEYCKVIKFESNGNENEICVSIVSDQIKIGMPAKDIVDILGAVSGRKDANNEKLYWWNWMPYDNDDQVIYVRVAADNATGNVVKFYIEFVR